MNEPDYLYLINRLEACSAINHPDRLWTDEFRVSCTEIWRGKEQQLKERVEKLEAELTDNK